MRENKVTIETGKTYLMSNAWKVRIICTDRRYDSLPIVGLYTTPDGNGEGILCLDTRGSDAYAKAQIVREINPWDNVAVDTPIWVKDISSNGGFWVRRHFAKLQDGKVYFWSNGKTSFTKDDGPACARYGASITDPTQ